MQLATFRYSIKMERIMVRVDSELVEQYRNRHPELKSLDTTKIVDVMLREALKKVKS